jgi:hypothetical protein
MDGRMMTRLSSAGSETFCLDCRRIIKSAAFNFEFKVASEGEGVLECKGPENDPRPGFKGPGKKAKCWLYDPSDNDQKAAAQRKARNSAYSAQHKKAASRIVNATAYFEGTPVTLGASNNSIDDLTQFSQALMSAPTTPTAATAAQATTPTTAPAAPAAASTGIAAPMTPGAALAPQLAATPTPATSTPAVSTQIANGTTGSSAPSPFDLDDTGIEQSPIGSVTAPGGLQPGDLNSNNPLNSGTTASKRLAALIEDDVKNHMGRGFCTEHMDYDECN